MHSDRAAKQHTLLLLKLRLRSPNPSKPLHCRNYYCHYSFL
jgi:hypothetical protein